MPTSTGTYAMMRSVGPRSRWIFRSLTAVLAAVACDSGSTVTRGLGSRQLLAIRDSTLTFVGPLRSSWVFYRATDATQTSLEYWSLDLDTGEARNFGSKIPTTTAPDQAARYDCQQTGEALTSLTIRDTQSGAVTVVDGVVAGDPTCPSGDDPTIGVWRQDVGGNLTYWTGPYDALEDVPLAMVVRKILPYHNDTGTSVLAYAAQPSQPDRVGLYNVDLATMAFTELVSPSLGTTTWAAGATPEGPLDSASLDVRNIRMVRGPGALQLRADHE
jgi:hypothetical protein